MSGVDMAILSLLATAVFMAGGIAVQVRINTRELRDHMKGEDERDGRIEKTLRWFGERLAGIETRLGIHAPPAGGSE